MPECYIYILVVIHTCLVHGSLGIPPVQYVKSFEEHDLRVRSLESVHTILEIASPLKLLLLSPYTNNAQLLQLTLCAIKIIHFLESACHIQYCSMYKPRIPFTALSEL